jgi:hypothetical protein
MFLAKNACMFFFFCIGASICIVRGSLFLSYEGFFLFLIWDGSWSYPIVIFQLVNNCNWLFTQSKDNTQLRQSCDKIHCIPTWFWLLP